MRIISGKYRGKNLFTPKDDNIRPTSDRAREAIFNVLSSRISNSWGEISMVELFAGTGAVSFEAISRGIKEVCMVDVDTSLANKNKELFSSDKERINIFKCDVTNLPLAPKQYDMMFMDAPYDKGLSEKSLKELSSKKWLKPEAICIIELEKKEIFTLPEGFELIDERVYGIAKFIIAAYK